MPLLTFPENDAAKHDAGRPGAGIPQEKNDDIEAFARRVGLEADAWQRGVLVSTAKRGILNCSRQWGKSTIAAAKAVHRAFTTAESLVLVAAPTERQSGEWMLKAEKMVERLGIRRRGDGTNKMSLLLPNGSRIVGLPGLDTTIRGFSAVSMLFIDEAALVADATYRALRPMLAVGNGDLWMMSTPRGKRGFFYETWEHGGPEWMRARGPATEVARIPKKFLEEQRRDMGADWFLQEHMCEFVGSGVGVFDREVVEAALDDEIEPMDD